MKLLNLVQLEKLLLKEQQTKNTVPHFYLTIESEVDNLLKLRKKINEQNLQIIKYQLMIFW